MKKAYYARPMSIYKTPQEERDKQLIRQLGYEPIDINKESLQRQAKEQGMSVFKPLVDSAEILFFRAFPSGDLGAGVVQEIAWANEAGIPILELPGRISRRALTVEQTREMLKESGQR